MPKTCGFEINGQTYHTDAETLSLLRQIIPAGQAANDTSAIQAVMALGLQTGRITLSPAQEA